MPDRGRLHYTSENSDALADYLAQCERVLRLLGQPPGPVTEKHPAANRLRRGVRYRKASEPSRHDYRERAPAIASLVLAA
jgi:hypothetical protein